jgi:hypothetical protein
MVANPELAGNELVGAADRGAYERIQRHIDALWEREAAAATALRAACEETREAMHAYAQAVDSTLGLIEVEVQLASAAAAAAAAVDADAFAAAVEAELAAWRLYVERLQLRAALKTGNARAQAEDAVRGLRRRVAALEQALERVRAASAGEWRAFAPAVTAAHDALVRAVDEASPKFE